jgi:hypothetical protein
MEGRGEGQKGGLSPADDSLEIERWRREVDRGNLQRVWSARRGDGGSFGFGPLCHVIVYWKGGREGKYSTEGNSWYWKALEQLLKLYFKRWKGCLADFGFLEWRTRCRMLTCYLGEISFLVILRGGSPSRLLTFKAVRILGVIRELLGLNFLDVQTRLVSRVCQRGSRLPPFPRSSGKTWNMTNSNTLRELGTDVNQHILGNVGVYSYFEQSSCL